MRAALELVSPSRCVGCGVGCPDDLCEECADETSILVPPLCPRCGGPPPVRRRCACRSLEGFELACSLVTFEDPSRKLVLELKRRGRPRLAAAMGGLMAELACHRELYTGRELVTFVPAAGRAKGYDHAEMLARAIARRLGARCLRLLVRQERGPRQADVSMSERKSNVAGRFGARATSGPVLLVDDVFTTGSTVERCALALREAGASAVNVVTWARTVRWRG